ncbi:hypothetical protein TNCT_400851 [Trichonephila clavata]|uniref:Uncharacterized protein n=1 Tax=Trichonephila clavata TaxID=2740835 RepID=A0A8X6KWJ9_TRICU|nr:hypothetical protein TNCT_400851 [Trichonephila clavata]
MKDLDDIDSEYEDEFENNIFKNNEVDLDVSANFDKKVESLISWKEVESSEAINVFPFSGKDKKENLSTSASYNAVNTMTDGIQDKGHKVFMDNSFPRRDFFETF